MCVCCSNAHDMRFSFWDYISEKAKRCYTKLFLARLYTVKIFFLKDFIFPTTLHFMRKVCMPLTEIPQCNYWNGTARIMSRCKCLRFFALRVYVQQDLNFFLTVYLLLDKILNKVFRAYFGYWYISKFSS